MKINSKTRVFITGCGGMLGEAFYHYFKDKTEVYTSDIDLNEEWLSYLDVMDYEQYRQQVLEFKPGIVIHLAALTDLEYCELNSSEAYATNTMAVENAVSVAREVDATLVYISTAGIFNGKKDEYDDWDTPDPINVYGRSKYLGEIFVEKNISKYFVCRAGWMMGGGAKKDKKFVKKILNQIENGESVLNVVDDKLGTPTYTYSFAENVFKLLETNFYGVYNMVCSGPTSRYNVAEEILNLLNKTNEIKLNKVGSTFFAKDYFAPRPYSEKLVNKKLQLRELDCMEDWKKSLGEYINRSYSHLIDKH